MGFRRIDMRESYMTKEDIKAYKELSRRYTWCDKHIANKFLKEIGIILTSHPGNRAFLWPSVRTHKQTKLWITLAYDNYFDPENKDLSWNEIMPSRDVIDSVNSFIISPFQKWGGVLYPYFWLLRLGLASMKDFPYIYCANGDCIIEKPEGIFVLLDILKTEDADFIACGWWDSERPIFNSTGFIGKSESIQKMMQHFQKYFVPLKAYEASCVDFGNCEGRMGRAIKDLGMKIVRVDNPKNEQMHEKGFGTWYDVLGFRHIHSEYGYAWKYRKRNPPPDVPEVKYFDEKYLTGGDLKFLKDSLARQNSKIAQAK